MELLHEVHPRRAARGDQRQDGVGVVEPFHELVGFLYDRQIGAEVGVEDGLKAHPPKSGVGLAGEVRADREPECLPDRDSDGRGELRHTVGIRVQELVPHLLRLVVLDDCPRGAVSGALAASDAR